MVGRVLVKIGNWLSRNRKGWVVSRVNRAIQILYFKLENDNYSLESNGEARVIKILSNLGFTQFIDVGANHGEWSLAVKASNREAQIHAFEASPVTHKILKQNLAAHSDIIANNLGLFDQKGSLDFLQNKDDGLSSLIPSEQNRNADHIKVDVTTLDEYVRENGIDKIDFLKIDTEGADYAILRGGEQTLRSGKVGVIQFEYGFVSVDTKNLLKDYYALLESYGYVVGKVYPRSVEFSKYYPSMENFIGPNFLAVRSELKEVIAALR